MALGKLHMQFAFKKLQAEIYWAESRDISGNFERTLSAKFETMTSEPRPKQRKNGQNCSEWLSFYTFSP